MAGVPVVGTRTVGTKQRRWQAGARAWSPLRESSHHDVTFSDTLSSKNKNKGGTSTQPMTSLSRLINLSVVNKQEACLVHEKTLWPLQNSYCVHYFGVLYWSKGYCTGIRFPLNVSLIKYRAWKRIGSISRVWELPLCNITHSRGSATFTASKNSKTGTRAKEAQLVLFHDYIEFVGVDLQEEVWKGLKEEEEESESHLLSNDFMTT